MPPRKTVNDGSAPDDLDTQILHAELRLIAREEALRMRVNALSQRVAEVARPARFAGPAVGGGALVLALWSLWRGKSSTKKQMLSAAGAARRTPTAGSGIPWARLVSLVWPLLPLPWRSRVPAAAAHTLIDIGLPLVGRLANKSGRRQKNDLVVPLLPAPYVDLARYAGTWYEVARLPERFEKACAGQPSAHYTPRAGGGLRIMNRCLGADGRERTVQGVGRTVKGGGGARLRVTFAPSWLRWLPIAWGDYWILYVDDRYNEAIVGNPSRSSLWLLSRQPQLIGGRLEALVGMARDKGFAVERLQFNAPD